MSTTAPNELELVQRVFDRIAAAATDDQLQAELLRYLAPVINKLNSDQDAIRNTVLEMLGHINRRIKDHDHIQLPVELLLQQFMAPNSTAFVVNFSLVYIKMGFPRLDGNKQVELLPKLLLSLESKPSHQQDSILVLLLPVLGGVKTPITILQEKPNIAKILMDFIQDLLLLPYGAKPMSQQSLKANYQRTAERRQLIEDNRLLRAQQPDDDDSNEEEEEDDAAPVPLVPACMSMTSFSRVIDGKRSPDQLEKLKLSLVKYLSMETLPPSSIAFAAIIATSDTRCAVSNAADSLLRRMDSTIKWNSDAIVFSLYIFFLGTLTPIRETPIEKFKNPADTKIRLKLMPCFMKSKDVTNFAPLAVKVFDECLWGRCSNSKLKRQGITFLHHISFSATTAKIKPVGSKLFSGVVRVINEEKSDAKLTSLAYGALAKLSLKMPHLLLSHTSQLHYLNTLMDALSQEVGDVLLAIQEALSMVAPVCKQLSPQSQEQLCILLSEHVQSDNPALRRTAVHYAASVFPQTHYASRFILLLATGDTQDDTRLEATRELYRPVNVDSKHSGAASRNSATNKDAGPTFLCPSFREMMGYIHARITAKERSHWREVANTPLPFSLKTIEEMLLYLQHCIAVESGRVGGANTGSTDASANSKESVVASFKENTITWPDCPVVGRFIRKTFNDVGDNVAAGSLSSFTNCYSVTGASSASSNTNQASSTITGRDSVTQYLSLCECAATAWSEVAIAALVRIVATDPTLLAPLYTARMEWVRRFLVRGNHAGHVAALLFGVVAGQIIDMSELERVLSTISHTKELRADSRECFVLAMCHSLARARLRIDADDDVVMMDSWQYYDEASVKLVGELVNPGPDGGGGMQTALVQGVGELARVAPLSLPPGDIDTLLKTYTTSKSSTDKQDEKETAEKQPAKSDASKKTDKASSSSKTPLERKPCTLASLFTTLCSVFENTKLSSRVREQAIQTTGYICVGQPKTPLRPAIVASLLRLASASAEVEVHFSVGAALTDCVLGRDSTSALDLWTQVEPSHAPIGGEQDQPEPMVTDAEGTEPGPSVTKETKPDSSSIDKEAESKQTGGGDVEGVDKEQPIAAEEGSLAWLLNELLQKYVPQSKPSVRQACCLWLLTLLKRCRHRPEVQRNLKPIQAAFMDLLADNNEFVQDAASKGLCVVYEVCRSEETRQMMVQGLVMTLTEGKSRAGGAVTGDTKIFHEGELGGNNKQLTTYKELCSLASDLNQPDLVYQFMNLANHNAVWNSRKGAAFGFGCLANQAGAALEPYLADIVPKLYRYQHDPTPKIQQPMAHIWSCLVQDTHATTLKHYDAILTDLLSSLTSNIWRVRESSCSGLAELIRLHSAVAALPQLPALWSSLFRVKDDIKESVRSAATKTLASLSKSCIKVCESGGTDGQAVLQCVLPVLLTDGLTSTVAEVRSVALDGIVKVCRSGGSMLKPHLATLVPALLEAIAGLEHAALGYTAVRSTTEEDRDRIDTLRVAASRSSPMMDTLNYVLQFVDADVMDEVMPGVIDVLKRSVGLTSRTASAHVIETLVHTCPAPLEKHAGKILSALVNGLNDRNGTVRKSFSSAIGTVIKVAKQSSIEKLLTKLQTWYLEKEEDSVRLSTGMTVRSMHRQSGDIMKQYASLAMPLAFLAMHSNSTSSSASGSGSAGGAGGSVSAQDAANGTEVWEEVWQDNTPGTEPGVRLHLSEILQVCETASLSSNWSMKAQAGRALATLAEKVGPTLTEEHTRNVVSLLISSLQGRTWAGKEHVTGALAATAVNTKPVLIKIPAIVLPEGSSSTSNSTNLSDCAMLIDQVVAVLIREASKEKKAYRLHAIRALTIVLEDFQIDKFEVVFDICSPFIIQCTDTSGGNSTTPGDSTSTTPAVVDDTPATVVVDATEEDLKWRLLEELLASTGRAWPRNKDTQERYSVRFVELLQSSVSKVPRKTQLTVISSLGKYWDRHYLLLNTSAGGSNDTKSSVIDTTTTDVDMEDLTEPQATTSTTDTSGRDSNTPLHDPLLETQFDPVIQQSSKIFNYCLGISKYYSLRKAALTVLLSVARRIRANPAILDKLRSQVMAAVEEARRDSQPDIQDVASQLHKILLS